MNDQKLRDILGLNRLLVLLAAMFFALTAHASEPSSFYARITLTPQQYQAFLQTPPGVAAAFNDWQSWFDSKKMYGDGKVSARDLQQAVWPSMQAFINSMDVHEYDPKTQTLKLAVMQFSENYADVLMKIYPLRKIADFRLKNKEGAKSSASDDFLIVYPYFWEQKFDQDNVLAYLKFKGNRSQFVSKIADADLKEATEFLDLLFEKRQGGSR